MNKKLEFCGRKMNLEIYFEQDDDEDILDEQKNTLDKFVINSEEMGKVEFAIKKYIEKNNFDSIKMDDIENIFKYVMPVKIFISNDTEERKVGIMCNYKYDPEHGIAIVFVNEQFKKIGYQEIML